VGKHARAFDYWTAKIDPAGLNAVAVDLDDPDLEELRKYFTRVDENVERIPVMKVIGFLYRFYLGEVLRLCRASILVVEPGFVRGAVSLFGRAEEEA